VSVCLSLSLAAFPHYRTDPDVTWENGMGVPFRAIRLSDPDPDSQ